MAPLNSTTVLLTALVLITTSARGRALPEQFAQLRDPTSLRTFLDFNEANIDNFGNTR